jgi:hypothetical protein
MKSRKRKKTLPTNKNIIPTYIWQVSKTISSKKNSSEQSMKQALNILLKFKMDVSQMLYMVMTFCAKQKQEQERQLYLHYLS